MHLYCLCCIPQFDCEWCHLVLEFVLFAAASLYRICCIQYGLVDWYRHFWRSSSTLNSEITNYLMKCGCLCCVQLARDASCYSFLGGRGAVITPSSLLLHHINGQAGRHHSVF